MNNNHELRNLANRIGLAWWAKIKTDKFNETFWFGPFLTRRSLKINIAVFLDDLSSEGNESIDYSFSRCRCIEPLTF